MCGCESVLLYSSLYLCVCVCVCVLIKQPTKEIKAENQAAVVNVVLKSKHAEGSPHLHHLTMAQIAKSSIKYAPKADRSS